MTHYKEILRLHSLGISGRSIAISCECSRNTVAKVLDRAGVLKLKWPLESDMTEGELSELLFPQSEIKSTGRKAPDLEYIHKEIGKPNVTLKLLWDEYCASCRLADEQPLMYTQFCYHYQKHAEKKRATMHIPRKPGEQTEVDWAGKTAFIVDSDTGEAIPVYIFVAALSYSGYAYVEGFLSQNQECWITAHVNMFRFFGGVTRAIVPDNLKTGVERTDWYTPTVNRTYRELAEHYNTAIIPARVRKPKDKPNAEETVGIISTWIIAALRNEKFFSLASLNAAIREKLQVFNSKLFQKKEGSRESLFLNEEKPLLMPLPANPYELASWKKATVAFNYHISVEKMYYSVHFSYIKQVVDVRLTRNVVEVFIGGNRICSHARLYGRTGQYSTLAEHMPESHQNYSSWDADRFIAWAKKIGIHAEMTVKTILSANKVQQQAFRSCMALLKLAEKYSDARLEAACKRALTYTSSPSYKVVKMIITSGQDELSEDNTAQSKNVEKYGFTRGAGYYGKR